MGFAVRVRSAGQKYGPTCHQRDRADVTEFVTLVRLSSLGQHVDVLALAGYKRRKSALTAGPIDARYICTGTAESCPQNHQTKTQDAGPRLRPQSELLMFVRCLPRLATSTSIPWATLSFAWHRSPAACNHGAAWRGSVHAASSGFCHNPTFPSPYDHNCCVDCNSTKELQKSSLIRRNILFCLYIYALISAGPRCSAFQPWQDSVPQLKSRSVGNGDPATSSLFWVLGQ